MFQNLIGMDELRPSFVVFVAAGQFAVTRNYRLPTYGIERETLRKRNRKRKKGSVVSYEEFLQEILGKHALQIFVDPTVLVRRTGLAHAQNRQSEVFHVYTRFWSTSCVIAALRMVFAIETMMMVMPMMMVPRKKPALGIARSPITSFVHRNRLLNRTSNVFVTSRDAPATESFCYQRHWCNWWVPRRRLLIARLQQRRLGGVFRTTLRATLSLRTHSLVSFLILLRRLQKRFSISFVSFASWASSLMGRPIRRGQRQIICTANLPT